MLPTFPSLQPRPGVAAGRLRQLTPSLKVLRTEAETQIASGFLHGHEVIGLDVLLDRYDEDAVVARVLISAAGHEQVFVLAQPLLAASRELHRLLGDGSYTKVLHNAPIKLARLGAAGLATRGYVDLMANAGWTSPLSAIAAHHGYDLPSAVTAEEVSGALISGVMPEWLLRRAAQHVFALPLILPLQLEVTRAWGLPDNWYELQRRAKAALGGTDVRWDLPEGARRYPRITIRLGTPSSPAMRAVRPEPATPVAKRVVPPRRAPAPTAPATSEPALVEA